MAFTHIDEETPCDGLVYLEEISVTDLVAGNNTDEHNIALVQGISRIRTYKDIYMRKGASQRKRIREQFQLRNGMHRECYECKSVIYHKFVVCSVCHASSKLVTDSELAVALLVPPFQEKVISKVMLGEVHNRGHRTPGGHFRRQSLNCHGRATQLGYQDILDRFNRSKEFRHNLYHCHLNPAE